MKRSRRVNGSAFLLLLPALAAACATEGPAAPARTEAAPVTVAKVERKEVPVELPAIGNVEAVSKVEVRSRVTGELKAVRFERGQRIRKGDVLFTLDRRPYEVALAEAEARLARDQALERAAKETVSRYQDLVEKDYVTKEQFDQIRANAESLAATLKADEAAVERARLDLSFCTIAAPIAGRAGDVLVHVGNLVKAEDENPMVVLLQTRPVFVTSSVPERYLAEIRARSSSGPLEVEAAVPEAGGVPRRGRLVFVDNAVNATTGTIRLKAEFPNEDDVLWPGQFVDVRLRLSTQPEALVVPARAVQTGQQGTFVFVVKDDGTVESRPVEVDRTLGTETVIAKGLHAGEAIVTDGQLRLVDGTPVTIKEGVR